MIILPLPVLWHSPGRKNSTEVKDGHAFCMGDSHVLFTTHQDLAERLAYVRSAMNILEYKNKIKSKVNGAKEVKVRFLWLIPLARLVSETTSHPPRPLTTFVPFLTAAAEFPPVCSKCPERSSMSSFTFQNV